MNNFFNDFRLKSSGPWVNQAAQLTSWCQDYKTFFFVTDAATNKLEWFSLGDLFSLVEYLIVRRVAYLSVVTSCRGLYYKNIMDS